MFSTLQWYIMSLLRKYCTLHYVNTVQYINYSVNTVQNITVVHYFCYSIDIITVQYYVNTAQYSMHFLLSNANNDAIIMEHTRADN